MSDIWCLDVVLNTRGNHGIAQKTRYCHWSNTARHRSNAADVIYGFVKCYVTDKLCFAWFRSRYAVYADIENCCTGFYPVATDHFRLANSCHQNVGIAA